MDGRCECCQADGQRRRTCGSTHKCKMNLDHHGRVIDIYYYSSKGKIEAMAVWFEEPNILKSPLAETENDKVFDVFFAHVVWKASKDPTTSRLRDRSGRIQTTRELISYLSSENRQPLTLWDDASLAAYRLALAPT